MERTEQQHEDRPQPVLRVDHGNCGSHIGEERRRHDHELLEERQRRQVRGVSDEAEAEVPIREDGSLHGPADGPQVEEGDEEDGGAEAPEDFECQL